MAHESSIYLWMYVDNWRMADAANSGYWRLMAEVSRPILLSCLILMVRSWAGGIAIGVLARRATQLNGVFFCLVLALADVTSAARYGHGDTNSPELALTFYRATYPLMLQTVLIMLPAVWGMILGGRRTAFRRG